MQHRPRQFGIEEGERQQHPDHPLAAMLASRDGGAGDDGLQPTPALRDGEHQHLLLALADWLQAGIGIIGQYDVAAAPMRGEDQG